MAQLAAISKGLYYPTWLEAVKLAAKHIGRMRDRKITLLDPCAGKGEALECLARELNSRDTWHEIETYGIEIEKERAEEAEKRLDHFVNAPFEMVDITGTPDVIFFNPPYDEVGGRRIELSWIDMISSLMGDHTLVIAVLPERFFENHESAADFRLTLWRNKLTLAHQGESSFPDEEDYLHAFRLPSPEYEKFKQHVVFLKKSGYSSRDLLPVVKVSGILGEVDTDKTISIGEVRGNYSTNNGMVIKKKIVPPAESVLNYDKIVKLIGAPRQKSTIRPLMGMRDEIVAAMIAGGTFGGIRVGEEIIRGSSRREYDTVIDEGMEGDSRVVTKTPRLIATIASVKISGPDAGTFDVIETSHKDFGDKLEVIAEKVKEIANTENPSIWQRENDFERLRSKFSKVRAPKMQYENLLPNQEVAATQIIRGWENDKAVFCFGEMGVGKSVTSIAAAIGQVAGKKNDAQKIVIFLPAKNDLVTKWKSEIAAACRDIPHTVYDIETITQTKRAFETKGIVFILVKESMIKRTSGVKDITLLKGGKCFSCGEKTTLVNKLGKLPDKKGEVLYCANCKTKYETHTRNKIGKADKFGNKGGAYASLARYISKRYSHSYILVVDEAHQVKGLDSARGYASASMIKAAKHVLMMTGTFYNGMASSMFANLYRCSGTFRSGNLHDGVMDFVKSYGLLQETLYQSKESYTRSWSGYGVKTAKNVKEIPGIHPAMIGLMLSQTVFMKLSDMEVKLPPQHEHTVFVDFPEKHAASVDAYLRKIEVKADSYRSDKELRRFGISLGSQHLWARSGAWDMAPLGDHVTDEFKKEVIFLDKIPVSGMMPKEDLLLRIIAKGMREETPTLVFYTQTDRRPIHERLEKLYKPYGVKLVTMPSSVSERLEFIVDALDKGANAVMMNANLVREGIDLLQFKQIAWYGDTPDAILVSQANARIDRIGKERETDVYYLAYRGTAQNSQWAVTANKVTAMQACNGDVKAGLAALLGEETLISMVQDKMIGADSSSSYMVIDDFEEVKMPIVAERTVEQPRKKEKKVTAPVDDIWLPKGKAQPLAQLSLF